MGRSLKCKTVAVLGLLLLLQACVKQPTHNQTTQDIRPTLSFTLQDKNANPRAYTVWVDGLEMGSLSQYVSGQAGLRVLSGSHVVRVEKEGEPVLETTVYVGNNVTKNILVK